MKLMKLFTHQVPVGGGGGYTQDLVISSKDIPGLKVGDIVEIYHPENEFSRLLIQVGSLKEELQQRDAISLEQTVAVTFQLKKFPQVFVSIVDPSDVALDLVELTFKDQYVGRSEMWRLGQNLVGTVAYLNKKIEFCQLIRCQVYEMFSGGERVAGGLITSDTRVVFRSASSMVYLFIQMSTEMWEFDIYGDMYFEKAINGFLSDLFTRWKKETCNHEVTIVLFSRTYYDASSVEAFPLEMRRQITQDFRDRFYEDYYRVLVHNERSEDWHQVLIQLRKAFNTFDDDVLKLNYKKYGQQNVPRAYNSSASQGNFLEVLNMSLNVFEKHYMDRSLDRTGQLSIVLTPGVGVFEVSRELTSVTKQRIIDCGICSDLVCVGEQPLHAVPLLRFQNRDTRDTDDYNIPHWLNLSFYSSNKKIGYSNFVPRIRVPALPSVNKETPKLLKSQSARVHCCSESDSLNQLFDYDAHDAQVFTLPTPVQRQTAKLTSRKDGRNSSVPPDGKKPKHHSRSVTRFKGHDEYLSTSHAPTLFLTKVNLGRSQDSDDLPGLRTVIGSEGSPLERQLAYRPKSRPGRALINPFDPSRVPMKHTSGRRRWIHIYPKQHRAKPFDDSMSISIGVDSRRGSHDSSRSSQAPQGEDWSPALPTGVDWKALTTPACLPITTDFFPDSASLQKDYVVSDYSISPEDVNVDDNVSRRRKPLETAQVYKEFVSQRLAQGFQLIIPPPAPRTTLRQSSLVDTKSPSPGPGGSSNTVIRNISHVEQPVEESLLSIGLIFHRITLRGPTITVTGYKPRHPLLSSKCTYVYNLRTTFMEDYRFSRTEFFTEKLQNYNWNHMDHYICTGGSPDFALTESLKYWRLRLCFIPLGYSKRFGQDPPSPTATEERVFDSFVKIVENVFNRMKQRPKKQKGYQALERTLTGVSKNERPNRLRAYSVRGKFEKGQFKSEGRNSPSFEESSSSTDSLPQDRQPGDSPKKISSESSLQEVVDALKGSLSFVEKGDDVLPPMTFVSGEAIQSLVEDHSLSKKEAKDFLQRLVSEGMVCHASGSKAVFQLFGGFHLFYFPKVNSPVKGKDRSSVYLMGDLSLFEQEFIEVDFDKYGNENDVSQIIAGYRQTDEESISEAANKYKAELQKLSVFKEAYLDVDIASRSDRREWGHLLYPSYFTPDASYITVLKWVEATGAIIFDLVLGWVRKAHSNGFLLVPMPMDPLFMGDNCRCDPFRAPLPIPVNVQVLEKFFDRYPDKHCLDRLWLLHDAIARRFGFIPCVFENSRRFQLQYVHSTGTSFLVVPVMPERDSGYSVAKPSVFSMREESPMTVRNFELPASGCESSLPVLDRGGHKMQCGFLWCTNYLLTKKWRISQTTDEAVHSKTLLDLLNFCQDQTRLSDFLSCDI